MTFARLFAALLVAGMALLGWNILEALRAESLLIAGPRLAADPWGWVTIVDVYLGFFVVWGYIWARERSVLRSLAWLVGILVLGNIVSALYLVIALHRGGYDIAALVRPAGSGHLASR